MSEINTGGGAAISGNDFTANELLVQCLNVAVVSDRQAILARLLAPPKVDKETRDKETGRYATGR